MGCDKDKETSSYCHEQTRLDWGRWNLLPVKIGLNGEEDRQKLKRLPMSMRLDVGWDFTEWRWCALSFKPQWQAGKHLSPGAATMEDAVWPDAGGSVWHLQVLCQLSLVPFKHSLWCLSLRESCFMSLIVDWLCWWWAWGTSLFFSPEVERQFPACVQRRLAGAGPWDQVTNHL